MSLGGILDGNLVGSLLSSVTSSQQSGGQGQQAGSILGLPALLINNFGGIINGIGGGGDGALVTDLLDLNLSPFLGSNVRNVQHFPGGRPPAGGLPCPPAGGGCLPGPGTPPPGGSPAAPSSPGTPGNRAPHSVLTDCPPPTPPGGGNCGPAPAPAPAPGGCGHCSGGKEPGAGNPPTTPTSGDGQGNDLLQSIFNNLFGGGGLLNDGLDVNANPALFSDSENSQCGGSGSAPGVPSGPGAPSGCGHRDGGDDAPTPGQNSGSGPGCGGVGGGNNADALLRMFFDHAYKNDTMDKGDVQGLTLLLAYLSGAFRPSNSSEPSQLDAQDAGMPELTQVSSPPQRWLN